MTLDPQQKISLVIALLGADLTAAAILFGVLGFLYAVYTNFAPPRIPHGPVAEMRTPILPHSILNPLAYVARTILGGLVIAAAMAFGCLFWFLTPKPWLFTGLCAGVLFEVVFLSVIGAVIVFRLMPIQKDTDT